MLIFPYIHISFIQASSDSLLVAAIDFGTTFSGWAFSFKHEFEKDPLKMSAKQWLGGQLVSLKGFVLHTNKQKEFKWANHVFLLFG